MTATPGKRVYPDNRLSKLKSEAPISYDRNGDGCTVLDPRTGTDKLLDRLRVYHSERIQVDA